MLGKIISLVALAAIAVIFVIGAILLIANFKKVTKSMVTGIVKNNLFRVSTLLFALLITACYVAGMFVQSIDSASAIITLNYAEASLGQNANGTRYNMAEITSDEVLSLAIEKGGFEGLTVDELSKSLDTAPLVEGDSYTEEEYHIATDYVLSYNATAKTRKFNSKTIVQVVCDAYREYYLGKYLTDFIVADEKYDENMSELDYFDKAEYLGKEANRIMNYMYGLQSKNSAFVSQNGATFASVASKVYNLKNTQIDGNLTAFILQNGIAEKPSEYTDRLKYFNKQSSFDSQKESESYAITNKAVKKYAEEMATVVLVPTWDKDGKYYMSRTKVGIDELSVQSVEFSEKWASIERQIKSNELEIKKFGTTAGNTAENKASADELIKDIHENLQKYAQEARSIGQEYFASQLNNCITYDIKGMSIKHYIIPAVLVCAGAYISLSVLKMGRKVASAKLDAGE